MQLNIVGLFFWAIGLYVLMLNLALVFIVEPKFLAKYYNKSEFYLKIKEPAAAIFLILVFVSSFFLGMMALLLKLFNQLLVF
ncbi:MAG: hypothetical protein ACOYL6_13300 [Bacteriovoracaceae bacterium]